MAPHQLYQQSGRLRVRMEDGTEIEAGNAETTAVPQDTSLGHGRRTGGRGAVLIPEGACWVVGHGLGGFLDAAGG